MADARTAGTYRAADDPFWYRVLDRFGVPVAALVFVAACVWFGGQYTLVEIVKPVADRHVRFVDQVESNQRATNEAISRLNESIRSQTALMEQILDEQKRGTRALEDHSRQ